MGYKIISKINNLKNLKGNQNKKTMMMKLMIIFNKKMIFVKSIIILSKKKIQI
jgi:hypothetical protein